MFSLCIMYSVKKGDVFGIQKLYFGDEVPLQGCQASSNRNFITSPSGPELIQVDLN